MIEFMITGLIAQISSEIITDKIQIQLTQINPKIEENKLSNEIKESKHI